MAEPETEKRRGKDIIRALMDPSRPDTVPWSSSDLRAMLEHQLAAPLACETLRLAETSRRSLVEIESLVGGLKGATFGQVLEDSTPRGDALELIKDYAKAALKLDGDLPRDVARVLYVMAILRGRQAGYPGISSLNDASLKREARRCLTFGWLPDRVQDLLRSALPRG